MGTPRRRAGVDVHSAYRIDGGLVRRHQVSSVARLPTGQRVDRSRIVATGVPNPASRGGGSGESRRWEKLTRHVPAPTMSVSTRGCFPVRGKGGAHLSV